ncbi:hypothetical protein KsCSTR_04050 [Candidatus Kuenenia stuttgartiensis]|uniref:Uncharacterized protein n=1 Tax=Kuenenia stuttgartiensis TaxID=174633 RepID=Q1PXR3_KUEST|nr:hypothetical protein KsCSTR_04050 [Candidatus Kuenenia stuttgartiensis]CAJ72830.1 unknown protein [Candidatus Kuenenia stuttgartiensis]
MDNISRCYECLLAKEIFTGEYATQHRTGLIRTTDLFHRLNPHGLYINLPIHRL